MQDDFRKVGGGLRLLYLLMLTVLALGAPLAHSASKTVLVLGDSLSAEYGLARGTGWVGLLDNRLTAERMDVEIVNASISGETTSGGRARLPALLKRHAPTHVVIELGANDGLRGLALAATKANLQAMISAARAAKAKVLLVGMQLPPNYGAAYTKRFSSMFPELAKENRVALVPFLLEDIADKPEMFQPDRIHPTMDAQPLMLETVWPHLKPLLEKSKKAELMKSN